MLRFYLIGGLAAALLLSGWLLTKAYKDNGELEAQKAGLVASNLSLHAGLRRVMDENLKADQVIADSQLRARTLKGQLDVIKLDFKKLGETHEEVKRYYDSAIPESVYKRMCKTNRCLPNRSGGVNHPESDDSGDTSPDDDG